MPTLEDTLDIAKSTELDTRELKLQIAYAKCIENGDVSALRTLQEVTKIKPSEEIIQERYANYIGSGRIDALRTLQEVTGIKLSEDNCTALIDRYITAD